MRAEELSPTLGPVVGDCDERGLLIPESLGALPWGRSRLHSNTCQSTCLGYGDETKIDRRHKLVTTRAKLPNVCNRQDQTGATCVGPVFGSSWVCRSCTCNFHNALCERHAKTAPPITGAFTHAPGMLATAAKRMAVDYQTAYNKWRTEWIEKWSLNKRLAIQHSQRMDMDEFAKVKSFVKRETGHKKVKKARAIQGYANFRTQAALGPQIYAAQKTCCQYFNHRNPQHEHSGIGITLASGMGAAELGDWMDYVHEKFGRPYFYERDGSNWDATMQAGHQDLVNEVYARILDPVTYQSIQWCREVKGSNVTISRDTKVATKISYRLKETTKSGHNDTSLRNSIINAAIAYEALRAVGVRAELIVAGDDLLVAMDRYVPASTLIKIEKDLGITPEAAVHDCYTKSTFISGHWIKDNKGFHFVPLLGRLLLRLYWTTSPLEVHEFQAFKYGVAEGLRPAIGNLPIYSALIDIPKPAKTNSTQVNKAIGEKYLMVWGQQQEFTKGTMQWFCDRYGTCPSEIASLEALIRDSVAVPCILKHALADRIIARDLQEVDQRG